MAGSGAKELRDTPLSDHKKERWKVLIYSRSIPKLTLTGWHILTLCQVRRPICGGHVQPCILAGHGPSANMQAFRQHQKQTDSSNQHWKLARKACLLRLIWPRTEDMIQTIHASRAMLARQALR